MELRILPLRGFGDITPGADLGLLISQSLQQQHLVPQADDILVVTQKIVSKAEGQLVNLADIEPSAFALDIAAQSGKDARHVEVVLREAKRIVRMDRGILVCETRHGFVCANAGVDESNVNGAHMLTLLPEDSDRSAREIRQRFSELNGSIAPAVIISDTWGRPWRQGQVNMAIGLAGMEPMTDYRGQHDAYGYELRASVIAIADELAAAAELVMGKIDQVPVALIRGYSYQPAEGSINSMLRDSSQDMFR
jgi:coenzyme F420-0:L-glutamate ligase/coenzyme F420-1:gamma-L-glutamate ligase